MTYKRKKRFVKSFKSHIAKRTLLKSKPTPNPKASSKAKPSALSVQSPKIAAKEVPKKDY